MKKDLQNLLRQYPYLMSEKTQYDLRDIRDHLFFMASITTAVTQVEEDNPLLLHRSVLGECFESFGERVDKVLESLEVAFAPKHTKADPS